MNKFSKEYLFRECVLHHHCILLRLSKAIKWDNDEVDVIYMVDMCMTDEKKKQMLVNIAKGLNTFGKIELKAFTDNESPYNAKKVFVLTDDILEIEIRNK